jgi:nucleotide-binding universal stress UspA family protein/quercetin dioxygenase-like cupin family protein
MPGIQTILHPTDFSENSRYAFQSACALARDYQATLFVLHVMPSSVSVFLQEPAPNPLLSLEAQGFRKRLPWPEPPDSEIRVEYRVAEGEIAEEILKLIETLRCDLVVMAAHGKSGLARLWTGNVAGQVMLQARCGVVVVNSPREATSAAGTPHPTPPASDHPIDGRPLGPALAAARSRTLFRTPALEVVRLIVQQGQEIFRQGGPGELLVHCLEGQVTITAVGKPQTLTAGLLKHLPAGEPYVIRGIEDASLLLIIL